MTREEYLGFIMKIEKPDNIAALEETLKSLKLHCNVPGLIVVNYSEGDTLRAIVALRLVSFGMGFSQIKLIAETLKFKAIDKHYQGRTLMIRRTVAGTFTVDVLDDESVLTDVILIKIPELK